MVRGRCCFVGLVFVRHREYFRKLDGEEQLYLSMILMEDAVVAVI